MLKKRHIVLLNNQNYLPYTIQLNYLLGMYWVIVQCIMILKIELKIN